MNINSLFFKDKEIERLTRELDLLNKLIECKEERIQMLEAKLTSYRKEYYHTFPQVPYSAVIYGRCKHCKEPITKPLDQATLCEVCGESIHHASKKEMVSHAFNKMRTSSNVLSVE